METLDQTSILELEVRDSIREVEDRAIILEVEDKDTTLEADRDTILEVTLATS